MKPLLLLDVDGPLNPWAAKPSKRPEGYETHRFRPRGWLEGESAKPLRVWLNPSHGTMLRALEEVFELVWATTWEDEANIFIGPHIGIPELVYIPWDVERRDTHVWNAGRKGGTWVHWKTEQIIEWAKGRPFVWVDDEVTLADQELIDQVHPVRSFVFQIDPRVGLTEHDTIDLRLLAQNL